VQSKGKKRLNPHGGELDAALKREFGSFYERLYQDLREPQFDFIREAFAEFLTVRIKSQSEPSTAAPCAFVRRSHVYFRRSSKATTEDYSPCNIRPD
jgi:hypothetical protein